jgi:hypothetical protein
MFNSFKWNGKTLNILKAYFKASHNSQLTKLKKTTKHMIQDSSQHLKQVSLERKSTALLFHQAGQCFH